MESRTIGSATRQAVYERNYRRARERALSRLRREFPDTYRQFFEEEKRKDEQEGKTWIDIDLDSGKPVRINAKNRSNPSAKRHSDREPQGNDEGEA